jgi:hypothetical protein
MLIFFYLSHNKWVMASLEEVWGSSFPKKHHNMASKYSQKEEPRDAEREGRVFPTPIHRTQAALHRHRKTIDDLSNSLPIVGSEEEAEANYGPAKIGNTVELNHFILQMGEQILPMLLLLFKKQLMILS